MSVAVDTDGLQPQDLVLTIVGAHVRESAPPVWSGGMVKILESLDFTTGSARAALARLVNRDLLARTRDGRRAFYAVTPRAEQLLAEGDRRIWSFGRSAPGDELWTVLWHAIPEDQRVSRSRFASRLRFLGFGAVQDATWVAAHDRVAELRPLLAQLKITEYVSLLVGRMAQDIPPVALVAQSWRLDEARERYEAFVAEFGRLRTKTARRRLSDAEAFCVRILLMHRFRSFPFIDPELPPRLDTLHDLREQAVACFDEVYDALEPAASEYFWQTVRPRQLAAAV